MVLADWSSCPSCKMCANYSALKKVLESDPVCPMCEANVPPMTVKIAEDASAEFKALINLMKDPTDNKEEIAEGNDLDSDDEDLLR
jgi:hypothetical protein